MPTVRVCDFLSFAVAASGIPAALVFLLSRPLDIPSVAWSLFIFLGFVVASAFIRMLGIIGQVLFDLRADFNARQEALRINAEHIGNDVSALRRIVDQVNCDTRDMNQGIGEIKTFFEQIQRHLNLKK